MQLAFILGIVFAALAVSFALQNNAPVAVSLIFWQFESSLALVLLLAIGIGALIAGLVSSPAMIRCQWQAKRLQRLLGGLEAEKAALERRMATLEQDIAAQGRPVPEPERPVVGLTRLLGGKLSDDDTPAPRG